MVKKIFIGALMVIGLTALVHAVFITKSNRQNQDTISRAVVTEDQDLDVTFEQQETVTADNTDMVDTEQVSGTFNRIDSVHYASGDVIIREEGDQVLIELQDNFKSAIGPDLYVYLAGDQNLEPKIKGFDREQGLNLGKLNNVNGKQVYAVSKAEFQQYNKAVVIYCFAFHVLFSYAELG